MSVEFGMIAQMFDNGGFDVLTRIIEAARTESRTAAERLVAIDELFRLRLV
ncbi:hypothetical protein [Mycobacterium basiliense]|nr:hypothetical protein [Mycobacterium basiliense]